MKLSDCQKEKLCDIVNYLHVYKADVLKHIYRQFK